MMIWIGLMLLICAGFSAYAGASQLEQAKQRAKCSLDAFTERRNGVSCICLAILFVILGIGINLWQRIFPVPVCFFQSLSDGFVMAPHRCSSPQAVLKDRYSFIFIFCLTAAIRAGPCKRLRSCCFGIFVHLKEAHAYGFTLWNGFGGIGRLWIQYDHTDKC